MTTQRTGPKRTTRCKVEGCRELRYDGCAYRFCEAHYLEYQRQAYRKSVVIRHEKRPLNLINLTAVIRQHEPVGVTALARLLGESYWRTRYAVLKAEKCGFIQPIAGKARFRSVRIG